MTRTKSQKAKAKAAKQAVLSQLMSQAGNSAPKPPRQRSAQAKPRDLSFSGSWEGFGAKASGSLKWTKNLGGNSGGRVPTASVMVAQDEMITTVNSPSISNAFQTQRFSINPGLAETFPWLSQMTLAYLKYKIHKLEFYFLPDVSAYATEGVRGKIMLSIDYDASGSSPATPQMVDATDPHVSAMAKEKCSLVGMPSRLNGEKEGNKFIRTGAVPAGNDIKTFDAGNLFFSAYGFSTTAALLGELHVSYQIELLIPKQELPVGVVPQPAPSTWCARFFTSHTTDTGGWGTGVYPSSGLMNGWTQQGANDIGVTLDTHELTLPPGSYVIHLDIQVGTPTTPIGNVFDIVRCYGSFGGSFPIFPQAVYYDGPTATALVVCTSLQYTNHVDIVSGTGLIVLVKQAVWGGASSGPAQWWANLTVQLV